MSTKSGYTLVRANMRDDLVAYIAQATGNTEQSRSQFLEIAVEEKRTRELDDTLQAGLHQRLDTLTVALDKIVSAMAQLTTKIDDRLKRMQQDIEEIKNHLSPPINAPSSPERNGTSRLHWNPLRRS